MNELVIFLFFITAAHLILVQAIAQDDVSELRKLDLALILVPILLFLGVLALQA